MAATLSPQFFGAILVLFLLHPFAAKSRPVKFESFENLENVQKGDVGDGITQVKQFLRAYGYYPGDVDPSDDRFDDVLESALKAYQEFYSLDVTGKIDPNTIKAMSTPRCGVPDINLEQTSNYKLFDKTKYKWNKYGVTYSYLSNSSQVPNLTQFKQAIARAFATWKSSSKFTFSEVKGSTADIGIGFYRKDHGDGNPFDGPIRPGFRNVLAHATPAQSRSVFLHFDAEDNWSFNPTSVLEFDVESIALHEIGHNLGLDHSNVTTAVMFPDYTGTRRTLDPDDIAGIKELYN